MTDLLLMLSSILIACSIRNFSLAVLDHYSGYRQSLRLKNLMRPSFGGKRLSSFFYAIEDNLRFLPKYRSIQLYLSYLERQIRRLGTSHLKPIHFLGSQALTALAAGIFFALLSESLPISLFAFLLGFLLPILWLRDQALNRERALLRELPNMTEILSLSSEAGLSLEQGMEQYAASAKTGPLRETVAGILNQTKTGSSRKNAFQEAASRLSLTDFSLFTTSVVQAERFGTGVAQTLRQLSMSLRDKQTQRAEKALQEMPVKLLLPLVFCIMPVTLLVIFGPILLQFFNP